MRTHNTEEETLGEKKSRPDIFLILSSVLFGLVCATSLFFFFENTSLSRAIEANKNEIAEYSNSIEKIKSDSKLIRSELVTNNKTALVAIIQNNKVQRYINELRDIGLKYKMMFSGFSYANSKITTSAIAIPEQTFAGEDGIKKISTFIQDYRTGNNLLFQLSPILAVSGYEQKRMFSLEFSVAPQSTTPVQK